MGEVGGSQGGAGGKQEQVRGWGWAEERGGCCGGPPGFPLGAPSRAAMPELPGTPDKDQVWGQKIMSVLP